MIRHAKGFPAPERLRQVVKQGAVGKAPAKGWSKPTEGSKWIITQAKRKDKRPLWVLVWGSITDVAQAVHDAPSIKAKLRVYSIGSWNTAMDRAARDYLFREHPDLWWIENDTTFRGMYMGGRQEGDWSDNPAPELVDHGRAGAKTVNRWRVDFLNDWRRRMTWTRGR